MPHGERLGELGLFSLGEAQGGLIHVYRYLMGDKRSWSQTLPSGAQQQDKKEQDLTDIEDIPLKKQLFYGEGGRMLAQAAHSGGTVFVLG